MSSDVLKLARPELMDLIPYTPASYEPDCIRMNANESPYRSLGDNTVRGLNIYPPPRPWALRTRLAAQYAVPEEEMLVTRGSSEAIDVLIRAFCAAGKDEILVCPPTFDMYRLYAGIQGAKVIEVPLRRDSDLSLDFAMDTEAVIEALNERTKLIFICSPNNPTGRSMTVSDVDAICDATRGRSLVILDEAYLEFSDRPSFRPLQEENDHLVLLRTLSKFVSLAGVRCGALIGTPKLVELLGSVLPPYTFPTPSIELVLEALSEDSLKTSTDRIALLRNERTRLATGLMNIPTITRVWPSDANFLLIETTGRERITEKARRGGILLRTFGEQKSLEQCVRITVGQPEENDLLLEVLGARTNQKNTVRSNDQ